MRTQANRVDRWAAGLVGIWLSIGRDGSPQRNFIPGFIIVLTGWAMSSHPQEMMISAMTHKMFGYTLMGVGFTRIIEICFVLNDQPGVSDDGRQIKAFQYVPVFVSYFFILWETNYRLTSSIASIRCRLPLHGCE